MSKSTKTNYPTKTELRALGDAELIAAFHDFHLGGADGFDYQAGMANLRTVMADRWMAMLEYSVGTGEHGDANRHKDAMDHHLADSVKHLKSARMAANEVKLRIKRSRPGNRTQHAIDEARQACYDALHSLGKTDDAHNDWRIAAGHPRA